MSCNILLYWYAVLKTYDMIIIRPCLNTNHAAESSCNWESPFTKWHNVNPAIITPSYSLWLSISYLTKCRFIMYSGTSVSMTARSNLEVEAAVYSGNSKTTHQNQCTKSISKLIKWYKTWLLRCIIPKCKMIHSGHQKDRRPHKMEDIYLKPVTEELDLSVLLTM